MIVETLLLRPAPWRGPRGVLLTVGVAVLFAWGVMLVHGGAWPGVSVGLAHTAGHELTTWMLMVLAAMVPLTYDNLRYTSIASFKERRAVACQFFLLGFLLPWLALGIIVAMLRPAIGPNAQGALFLALTAAVVWFPVPLRRRAVVAAHREISLAPRGWPAIRDAVRFGSVIGRSSILSCGPLMVACALAGHNALLLLGSAGILTAEHVRYPRDQRETLLAVIALSLVFAALVAFGPRGDT